MLTGVQEEADGSYSYRGFKIEPEDDKLGLRQYIYMDGETSQGDPLYVNSERVGSVVYYPCKKVNGAKYYQDASGAFAVINGIRHDQKDVEDVAKNRSGIEFYKNAWNFKTFIKSKSTLMDLKTSDAVDANGNKYTTMGDDNPFPNDYKIFDEIDNTTGTYIEDATSEFNEHRIQVIKNSIETNLVPAISNYNRISTSSVNFQMPKLNDEEWDKITRKCINDNIPSRIKYRW